MDDGPGAAESGDLPAAIGGYRILRRLGAGAMGTVYLAAEEGRPGLALPLLEETLRIGDGPSKCAFLLWRATGDAGRLEEAHRILLDLRDHAPAESRSSLIREVPLHREIVDAWAARSPSG